MLPLLRSRYRSRLALVTAEPDAYAEVHPELARRVGVGSGDQIRLDTRRGSAVLRARISNTIRTTRSCALSRGGLQAATALTNPALDPISPMPEFKACAVAFSAVPDYAPSRLDSVANGCP